jgi:hypothetical protein
VFNPHDPGAMPAHFSAIPRIDPALEIFALSLLLSGIKTYAASICGIKFLKAYESALSLELSTNMDLTKPTDLVNY